jgi:PAP2 superfamily
VTTTAAASMTARRPGRLRAWLSVRHSLRSEAVAVLTVYGLYELARGLVASDAEEADRHAHRLVALERSLHLFLEANVQRAAHALRDLNGLLGIAYLTLHLAVTAGVLLWLHQRRPTVFPFVRTTLLLASGLAIVGYLAYPTAPPRLAGIGITPPAHSSPRWPRPQPPSSHDPPPPAGSQLSPRSASHCPRSKSWRRKR